MERMAVAAGKFLVVRVQRPHALDFFDLEATVRERLSAAVERDATAENFLLQPESTRGGSIAGFSNFGVHAWAGSGLMNQQLRLNGALVQPIALGFQPASTQP
jgi:hypothetical protein